MIGRGIGIPFRRGTGGGTSISLSGNANMVLYRITGFTEALTTDQVWKWYQKNKPKGGDK